MLVLPTVFAPTLESPLSTISFRLALWRVHYGGRVVARGISHLLFPTVFPELGLSLSVPRPMLVTAC